MNGRTSRGTNDLSWYTKYPELSAASASLPFPNRPGMAISTLATLGDVVDQTATFNIPGVWAIDWVPSLGTSIVNTDPASVAAKEIYARVRANFSGSLSVDAPDFMVYLMALDSIYAYIAYLKRIYRTLSAWTPDNYATPDQLLKAMNFASGEVLALRSNKVQLWQIINELVRQVSKFTCPATMHIMNRHYWMSDNVYTDANSMNAQFYLFNLIRVYKYADQPTMDDSSVTAGGLTQVVLPNATFGSSRNVSVTAFYQFGLQLIQALVDWDDAYTINGYLKKAYEGNPMFMVELLPPEEGLTPEYNEEVLAQIENATAIYRGSAVYSGTSLITLNMDCRQNVTKNILNSNPTITYASTTNNIPSTLDGYFSLRTDKPGPADVILASRLKSWVNRQPVTGQQYLVYGGSEIVLLHRIINTGLNDTIAAATGYFLDSQLNQSSFTAFYCAYIAQFDWHPILMVLNPSGSELAPLGDIHNFAFIKPTDLQNINRICMFSELDAFAGN